MCLLIKSERWFKLDKQYAPSGDLGKVREESNEIQNKLIIEEDDFPMQKNSTLKIKDFVDADTIVGLCMNFNKIQRQVIFLLLEERVLVAEDLVTDDNKMLSLVIDEINELSTGIIGDVIIIDYQVVKDYKEELIKELSKNNCY